MISAQTRFRVCREGKPLHAFPDHAPAEGAASLAGIRKKPRGRPGSAIVREELPSDIFPIYVWDRVFKGLPARLGLHAK
jgi:hypothetical protein